VGGERWARFKYTRNEKRARWIDALSPYASTIASIIPKIDWTAFTYNGPIEIETELKEEMTTRTANCRSIGPLLHEAFGGGACELWGSVIPEVPIRNYVDFTGDLDVRVTPPEFIVEDPAFIATLHSLGIADFEPYMSSPILLGEHGFTEYGEAVTQWLYNQVVDRVREISPYFNKPGFVVPDYREDSETAISDLQTVVGNILVCRSPMLDRGMIKIQLTVKIESDSTAEMDHILELILLTKGGFKISKNGFTVGGICLQEPRQLLLDQINGLIGRGTGILNTREKHPGADRVENYPSFYKYDNHCARILYLAHLQKAVEGRQIGDSQKLANKLAKGDILYKLAKMYEASCDKLCSKHFGDDYMDQLIAVFETMDLIRPGGLTVRLNPYNRTLITKAKAEARAMGGRRRTRKAR